MNRGVPQGSILGPILFLAMIHDMPDYLSRNSLNIGITGYADDTTVHVKEKTIEDVITKIETTAMNMIQYCNENELIINAKKI